MKKGFFLLISTAALLLASCAKTSEEGFISGAEKRSSKNVEMLMNTASTTYTIPAMDRVRVRTDLEYHEGRLMDIYYPPDFDFSQKLPAVVIYNGLPGLSLKNMGRHIDWAALLGASGMIGIAYDVVYPDKDIRRLCDFISSNEKSLGVDAENLGLLSYCEACLQGLKAFDTGNPNFCENMKTGVFLYGSLPWSETINPEASLMVVKTGKGLSPFTSESIDMFLEKGWERGMDIRLLDYEKGMKYFDITEQNFEPWERAQNPVYQSDCENTREILSYFKENLGLLKA